MPGKPSVLLVEDERSIRRGLADILAYHGYVVAPFDNAEDALSFAESHQLVS